jgi:hypothetical protein
MGDRRRDEAYALDLGDQVIGAESRREFTFDWLVAIQARMGAAASCLWTPTGLR